MNDLGYDQAMQLRSALMPIAYLLCTTGLLLAVFRHWGNFHEILMSMVGIFIIVILLNGYPTALTTVADGFKTLREQTTSNAPGTHPASLSTAETIRRLRSAWTAHAKKCRSTDISHHRLVFSMSKDFHDAVVRAGRNPDMVLRGIVEQSMRSLQEKFHAGDSVGYSYGLHHDTDNLHAHVFIHPRTRDGDFVGLSEQLKRKAARGAASRHKNQLKFVRENARRRATQVLKQLSISREATHLKDNLYSDRMFFIPRVSHTARRKNDFRPRTPADYQLEQKRAAVVALDKQISANRVALREASGGSHIAAIFRLRQPKWLKLMKQAQAATLFRELRELQAKRFRLVSEYRAARRLLIPAPDATRTVPKRKRAKVPVATVTPPTSKPTVTAKPAAKPKRHRRGL